MSNAATVATYRVEALLEMLISGQRHRYTMVVDGIVAPSAQESIRIARGRWAEHGWIGPFRQVTAENETDFLDVWRTFND